MEAIRLLVKPEDLSGTNVGVQGLLPRVTVRMVFYPCVDIFDLTVHLRSEDALDIASAVGRNFDATQSLVTRFIQMGGIAPTDAYVDTQKAQTEVS